MNDEKFKLNKSNIILINITSLLLISVIIFSILLIISLNDPNTDLPYLEVTEGRTSTKYKTTSINTTTTTITTTTTRILTSPYYEVNMDNYLNSDLFTKQTLNKDEAKIVITELYELANKFYNISDNSLLDIKATIEHSKLNEIDSITNNNDKYGIIYNYSDIVDKLFVEDIKLRITRFKYNGSNVFMKSNNNYYRLENKMDNVELILVSLNLNSVSNGIVEASTTYYKSNYREEGYSSPVYKTVKIEAKYENNRWKISNYNYPLYD